MGTKDDVLETLLNLVKEDELSLYDVKHMLAISMSCILLLLILIWYAFTTG